MPRREGRYAAKTTPTQISFEDREVTGRRKGIPDRPGDTRITLGANASLDESLPKVSIRGKEMSCRPRCAPIRALSSFDTVVFPGARPEILSVTSRSRLGRVSRPGHTPSAGPPVSSAYAICCPPGRLSLQPAAQGRRRKWVGFPFRREKRTLFRTREFDVER